MSRARRCGAGLVGGLIATAAVVVPVRSAQATGSPPVVDVRTSGAKTKVSGAKGLHAGWVKIRFTADLDGIWFTLTKYHSGASAAVAHKATKSLGARRPQAVQSNSEGATDPNGVPYSADAATSRGFESSWTGLGGATLLKKQPTEFTVQLPSGKIEIDFSSRSLSDPIPPPVFLDVAKSPRAYRPGHADATFAEGNSNRITGPGSLPSTGRLAIANRSSKGWHEFVLEPLLPGKTAQDVQSYYRGKADSPFADTAMSYTGFWPLAAGLTEYLTYRLKPGRYALFDLWADEHTGHIHAQDGAVKLVTVR